MNILYILGNGFDINLGLKTRYSDFYKYYVKIESKNENIRKLKDDIEGDQNWSDLELKLGEYSSKVDSSEDFIELVEDIVECLADYIAEEEMKLDELEIDYKKFLDNLSFPEKNLSRLQSNILKEFKESFGRVSWKINILSFNYTRTIEEIMMNVIDMPTNYYGFSIAYKGTHHIHGFHDKNIVLGVNDTSQIQNDEFSEAVEVKRAFIKKDCNKAMEHTEELICEKKIEGANMILIFGSSLGHTDKIWWEMIGKKLLNNNFKLIIFYHLDTNFSLRRPNKKIKHREKIIDDFLSKTSLTDQQKEVVRKNIMVGINTDMFRDILIKSE